MLNLKYEETEFPSKAPVVFVKPLTACIFQEFHLNPRPLESSNPSSLATLIGLLKKN
jgi:hypothetical protein